MNFQPPACFSFVTVEALEELKIHFHNAKLMVHKHHNEAEAPMPNYVNCFFTKALKRNIGLTELVVDAMMKNTTAK